MGIQEFGDTFLEDNFIRNVCHLVFANLLLHLSVLKPVQIADISHQGRSVFIDAY